MRIIEILTDLANNLPNNYQIDEKIKDQSYLIQNAIKSNNSEELRSCISNKMFYANEVKVTVY